MLSSRFLLELLGSRIVPMSLLCVCVCSDSFTDAAPPRHFGRLFLCFTALQSMLSASLTLPHGTDLGLVFFFFFLPIVVVIGTKVQTEVPVSAVNHSFLPKLLAPGQYLEKLNPKTFSQSR